MGKDMTKASDHPTTDSLAKTDSDGRRVGDDVDTEGTPIGFSFGSRTLRLDSVPELDDVLVIVLKCQVIRDGNARNAKGEIIPQRNVKILSGWKPGKKPLSEDPNQPGLYEIDPVDGSPDADGGYEDDDSVDTGDSDAVESPAFSDGKSAAAGSDE